jgi:Lsr2
MTITATRPLPLTPDDAKILAAYAGGDSAAEICTATGFSLARVGRVLDEHAGNNRELAHQVVLDYAERTHAATPTTPATTTMPPRPTPAATAEPGAVEAAGEPAAEPAGDPIAALLDQVDATGEPRLHRSAVKIRELVDSLRTDLTQHLREVPLRAEQARLRARLAEIDAQLQARPAPTTSEQPEVDTKKVRAWAAEQGLDCSAHGRIPGAVLAAYREAHQ